jgi:hypothetical protein
MLWMALSSLALALGPVAQDAPSAEQLSQIAEELQAVRKENAELRQRMSDLEAEAGETWLTEQRANEIRGLVQDVLADADSRASLRQSGMTAGWDNGFFIASPDGDYRLNIEGQLQFRYVYSFHDIPDRHLGGFENTRTKLTFRGHVINRDISYLIRGAFERRDDSTTGDDHTVPNPRGGRFELEDAWINWDLNNAVKLRVGQMKLPFNREELVSSQHQLAVERSLVNQNLNIGRSQGVLVEWFSRSFRVTGMFSDGGADEVGGENDVDLTGTTNPINSPALSQDTEYAITARGEWKVAGDWPQFQDFTSPHTDDFGLLIGIAGHHQDSESTGNFTGIRNEVPWTAWTIDASAEFGGANAFASFTHHYFDRATGHFNVFGLVLQGGVYILPKWEVFARYEYGWWDFDNDDSFTDLSVVTVGTNYYFNDHNLKFTADIGVGLDQLELLWDSDIAGWRDETDQANPQVVIRMQMQLLF